jgi:hypothetical protein
MMTMMTMMTMMRKKTQNSSLDVMMIDCTQLTAINTTQHQQHQSYDNQTIKAPRIHFARSQESSITKQQEQCARVRQPRTARHTLQRLLFVVTHLILELSSLHSARIVRMVGAHGGEMQHKHDHNTEHKLEHKHEH